MSKINYVHPKRAPKPQKVALLPGQSIVLTGPRAGTIEEAPKAKINYRKGA